MHSILEETRHISGTKSIKGSIAYVEQEPFILPGTIKENILFGKSDATDAEVRQVAEMSNAI